MWPLSTVFMFSSDVIGVTIYHKCTQHIYTIRDLIKSLDTLYVAYVRLIYMMVLGKQP